MLITSAQSDSCNSLLMIDFVKLDILFVVKKMEGQRQRINVGFFVGNGEEKRDTLSLVSSGCARSIVTASFLGGKGKELGTFVSFQWKVRVNTNQCREFYWLKCRWMHICFWERACQHFLSWDKVWRFLCS